MDHVSWKAFIRLSLVSVPVQAYTAAKPIREQIVFHQLHQGHARIHYRKVCPIHGEVPNDEIVKGYEYAKGEYVVVTADEIERIQMDGDRSIDVRAFVSPKAIDPLYFSGKSYYLTPDGPAGQKPYDLLQEAMTRKGLYAVGTMVLAGRQQLVVLRPVEHVLTISGLQYASQLRDVSEFNGDNDERDFSSKELELTETLIGATTEKHFDLAQYRDEYEEKLRELIEAKVAGKEITIAAVEEPRTAINLMDALRESLAQVKRPGRSRAASTHKSDGRRKAPAALRPRSVASRKRKPG
jgi:DNA end-binding protein Ku